MSNRITYFDNLKMILMFFVVLGHAIAYSQWTSNVHLLSIFNCIYAFHMPLFVFISGYFSKHITNPRRKDVETLLYPYLIFQIINIFYVRYVEHGTANWNLFIPLHQNWYILALFIWRLIIPYFKFINKILGIGIALFLALMFSKYQIPNNLFALSYIFVFLPFFVIGYYLEESLLHKVMKRPIIIGISIFILILFMAIIVGTHYNTNIGMMIAQAFRPPYICKSSLSYAMRCLSFILTILLIYLLFAVKWHQEKVNTKSVSILSVGTILVYLLHYFIIIPLWKVLPHYNWIISLIICIGISFAICWVFSRPRVMKILMPLVDFGVLREKIVIIKQKKTNK